MDTNALYVFYTVTTYVGQTYIIHGIQKADTTTGQTIIWSLDNPGIVFLIQMC